MTKDGKERILGAPLNSLPEDQAKPLMEIVRSKDKDLSFEDVGVAYENGHVVLYNAAKAGISNKTTPAVKNTPGYKKLVENVFKNGIPESAVIGRPTQVELDLIGNQTLGNKSQLQVVEESDEEGQTIITTVPKQPKFKGLPPNKKF